MALPVLIHGDAAYIGQGVVAETLNLARLAGYSTGGTVHIITNNQLGFTTDPREARSTDYASDLAKGFDHPIIHVNADDPAACLAAVRLAMAYRERFRGDVIIDLVGYRRHGHNEADEPAYTQPQMYERIAALPSVREQWAEQTGRAGRSRAARKSRRCSADGVRPAGAQVQQAVKAQGKEGDGVGTALEPHESEELAPAQEAVRSGDRRARGGRCGRSTASCTPGPTASRSTPSCSGSSSGAARACDGGAAASSGRTPRRWPSRRSWSRASRSG